MRKKIFSVAIVCFLLCASALSLLACGGGHSKDAAYQDAVELFETIDSQLTEDGMFTDHEVDGVQSEYSLTIYWDHPTFNYFNKLFVIPMNYLKNYYPDLQRLQYPEVKISKTGQKAIDNFADGLAQFKIGYLKCIDDYATYKNIILKGNNSPVWEGLAAIYNQSLKQMFDGVYQAANSLAQIKDKVFDDFSGLEVTNQKLSNKDVAQLRDFLVLESATDLYNVLILNMNMQNFAGATESLGVSDFITLKNSLVTRTSELMKLQAIASFQDLTGRATTASDEETVIEYVNTKITNLLEVQADMSGERELLNTSLEKFNLKTFYEDYSCNFEAYSHRLTYAKEYFQEICSYYESYMQSYISYLTQHLQPGE